VMAAAPADRQLERRDGHYKWNPGAEITPGRWSGLTPTVDSRCE
jgi:hypothetical protein